MNLNENMMIDDKRKRIINEALLIVIEWCEIDKTQDRQSNFRKISFMKRIISLPAEEITKIQLEMVEKIIKKYLDEL